MQLTSIPVVGHLFRAARRTTRYSGFVREFVSFQRASAENGRGLPVRWGERLPFLSDRTESIGFEPHYLYHPAWAARCLARLRPERHVDISSSVYFVATVSAFVPVDYYEYRPTPLGLDNLTSHAADLIALPFSDASIPSLSCMHTVEHVGLGRYGDALDVDGDKKAAAELARVLAPGGSLLFVVPVGRPHVRFNANRVYSLEAVKQLFPTLRLKESLLITDDAQLVPDAGEAETARQQEGCGCYWFVKDGGSDISGDADGQVEASGEDRRGNEN